MVTIDTIVWFVFAAIIVVAILGLLWFAIGYCEKKIPAPPLAWTIVRVVFVLLCVFMLVAILLGMIGHPIVRF